MSNDNRYQEIKDRLAVLDARDAQTPPVEVISEVSLAPLEGAAFDGAGLAGATGIVEQTLTNLVGAPWGDWPAVEAGMAANVQFTEVGGVRQSVVRPKGFTIRADLGALTGAQQVIAEQFYAMRDRIVPELRGLQPLAVAASAQQVESIRGIVIDAIGVLADAYAILDGVNVQLADKTWVALLGKSPSKDPERPNRRSHLWQLKRVFGFYRELVNTTDQELAYSKFIGIVSSLNGELAAYQFHRPYLVGEDPARYEPYLGPTFRGLAVLLGVLAENQRELAGALFANFFDDKQWKSQFLETSDGRLNFGTYMQWLADFPGRAQETLRSQGKEGARSLIAEVERLVDATSAAAPPIGWFPALYNKSPIVLSAQGAVERTLLRTLQALLPFSRPGAGPILTVGLPDDGEPEPELGDSPAESWQPVHVSGPYVAIRIVGDVPKMGSIKVGLRGLDGTPIWGMQQWAAPRESLHYVDITGLAPGPHDVVLSHEGVVYRLGQTVVAPPPGLAGTPVTGWQPLHVAGPQFGVRLEGGGFVPGALRVGLRKSKRATPKWGEETWMSPQETLHHVDITGEQPGPREVILEHNGQVYELGEMTIG